MAKGLLGEEWAQSCHVAATPAPRTCSDGLLGLDLRGVHPLVLSALAQQQVRFKSAPARLKDLTTRDVVECALRPWLRACGAVSIASAYQQGALELPEHPLSKEASTSQAYICSEGSYAEYHTYLESDVVSVVPATLQGALDGKCDSPVRRSHKHKSKTLQGTPALYYVVHSWDMRFGDLVATVMAHYEAQMWGAMDAEKAAQYRAASYLQHKRDEWLCVGQVPTYYWLDILAVDQTQPPEDRTAALGTCVEDVMAASHGVLLCAVPSLKQPVAMNRLWCQYELLVATELKKHICLGLPTYTVYQQDSLLGAAQLLEELEKMEWLRVDFATAETSVPSDRDYLVQLMQSAMLIEPPTTSQPAAAAGQRKATPLQILRARLRAAIAEAILWSHMLSKYPADAVWRCKHAADELARQAAAAHTASNAELYQLALRKDSQTSTSNGADTFTPAPPSPSKHSFTRSPKPLSRRSSLIIDAQYGPTFSPAATVATAASPTGMLPAIGRRVSITAPAAATMDPADAPVAAAPHAAPAPHRSELAKLVIEVPAHAEGALYRLVRDARNAHPAVPWLHFKCTCHCAACTALTAAPGSLTTTASRSGTLPRLVPTATPTNPTVPTQQNTTDCALDVFPSYAKKSSTCTACGYPVLALRGAHADAPGPAVPGMGAASETAKKRASAGVCGPSISGGGLGIPLTGLLASPQSGTGAASGTHTPYSRFGPSRVSMGGSVVVSSNRVSVGGGGSPLSSYHASPRSSCNGINVPSLDTLLQRAQVAGLAGGMAGAHPPTRLSMPGSMPLPSLDSNRNVATGFLINQHSAHGDHEGHSGTRTSSTSSLIKKHSSAASTRQRFENLVGQESPAGSEPSSPLPHARSGALRALQRDSVATAGPRRTSLEEARGGTPPPLGAAAPDLARVSREVSGDTGLRAALIADVNASLAAPKRSPQMLSVGPRAGAADAAAMSNSAGKKVAGTVNLSTDLASAGSSNGKRLKALNSVLERGLAALHLRKGHGTS